MRRTVGSLLIAATMAMLVTGVLVVTTDSDTTDDDAVARIESTTGAAAAAPAVPAQGDGAPDTPSYLDPQPIEQPPAAEVLGVTQSQEAADDLADTGPIDVGMWVTAAVTMIALGITVVCAARDHAAGRLTLLP